jgi:hypothetical protein
LLLKERKPGLAMPVLRNRLLLLSSKIIFFNKKLFFFEAEPLCFASTLKPEFQKSDSSFFWTLGAGYRS